MNFKIYVIGKIKSKSHLASIQEYEKRLSRYCKIKLIELKSLDVYRQINDKSYKIQVHPKGKQYSSEAFAEKINTLGVTGKSDISFIYTDEEITSDDSLSLVSMTMSNGIFATVMFEQIYRGYRILKNEPYHK